MGRVLAYDLYTSHSSKRENGDDPVGKEDKKIVYSYHEVLTMSTHLHKFFIEQKKKLDAPAVPQRIAFLCPPGPTYIATQFASWSSGSIAVPLCTSHRSGELAYVLQDCDPTFVIDGTSTLSEGRELRMAAREAGVMDRYWCLNDMMADFSHPSPLEKQPQPQGQLIAGDEAAGGVHEYALGSDGDIPSRDHPALIIYTSGTTGNPKGVVHTHKNIYHQITDLVTSWGWSADDSILHFLPLHHVHGVINKLGCAIWAGGSVEFVRFHPIRIWERLAEASQRWRRDLPSNKDDASGDASNDIDDVRREPTVFMAVPTIYAKMLEVVPQLPTTLNPSEIMRQSPIRLMVSGSAALPTGIFNRWKDLTGHTILERYGMSEFAMALSNPLEPIEKRLPGYVGLPLPSVEVKIIDEDTGDVIPNQTGSTVSPQSGELCVRGPTVFSEYWQKSHATAESFDFDGFFKTGDVAEYDPTCNSYHILGRVSADIIKCAGHKLSSLQIERALLEHPSVVEAVVLGVPDETYGERVGLICRLRSNELNLDLKTLRLWCRDHMASYKIPSRMIVMENDIPKNVMGKVSKKQLVHLFEDEEKVQKSN